MKTPKCYTWLESCGSHLSGGVKEKIFFCILQSVWFSRTLRTDIFLYTEKLSYAILFYLPVPKVLGQDSSKRLLCLSVGRAPLPTRPTGTTTHCIVEACLQFHAYTVHTYPPTYLPCTSYHREHPQRAILKTEEAWPDQQNTMTMTMTKTWPSKSDPTDLWPLSKAWRHFSDIHSSEPSIKSNMGQNSQFVQCLYFVLAYFNAWMSAMFPFCLKFFKISFPSTCVFLYIPTCIFPQRQCSQTYSTPTTTLKMRKIGQGRK